MLNKKVCICIPVYNAEKTISETIASIVNQSYANLIIKVIDNASTDNTVKIVESFKKIDERIKIYCYKEHISDDNIFNRPIELAEGEYTAIFHADDVYYPEIIEKSVSLLEKNSGIGAVFSNANIIDEHGVKKGLLNNFDTIFPESADERNYSFDEIFKKILIYGNLMVCSSGVVRTDIYKNYIKKWAINNFKTSSDLGVWLRILEKYQINIIKKPLMNYRVSMASYSYRIKFKRTEPYDFFTVIDFYLQGFARKYIENKHITNKDLQFYDFQRKKSCVLLARNCLINNDKKKSKCYLKTTLTFQYLPLCKNFYDIKLFFIAITLYLLSNLPFGYTLCKFYYSKKK